MKTGRKWQGSIIVSSLLLLGSAAGALAQGRSHKVVAAPGVLDGQEGVRLIEDYGSYRLYRVTDQALGALSRSARDRAHVADEMDVIKLDAYPLDTHDPVVHAPARLLAKPTRESALHLVQFVGPIKNEWLDDLRKMGVRPVQYIESNAYLVWASGAHRTALDVLAARGDFIQYSGPYHAVYKLGPSLRGPVAEPSGDDRLVPVTIQILSQEGKKDTQRRIEAASVSVDSSWEPVLSYENVKVTIPMSRVAEIASLPDVTWVGERFPITMMDEVQDQIVAGHFDGTQSGPSGPGYKAFLDAKGFSSNPADYPVVAVTDDGVGNGTVTNGAGDPTLTALGDGTTTRLTYITNCTTSATGGGIGGHGHINTSIVGGYDVRAGQPYRDADGFQRGLGVSPYGRMGSTKIFTDGGSYSIGGCGGTDASVIASSYNNGGRISTNSWGCGSCAASYDTLSQAYDAGTRDALPTTMAGNQEYLFVFAAGNSGSGAGTVGTPGNGKNMITVGASENDRPTVDGALWPSGGCPGNGGPTAADNAMDVIGFSSRGPSPGGRKKPEVIAPGTHIQGTASTNAGYTGALVCDKYIPTTQTTFAASSGTSHSTPAMAGVASLYYRWLQTHHLNATPSPALIKAYMMTHTTYLTGLTANDTLPSNSQGYGMPNLEIAFDDTPRVLLDQSVLLDNSGQTWTFNGSVADPSKPVRIMMVYTDAPGATGTSPQVNNLNLAATVGGTPYLGNVFGAPPNGQYSTTGGSPDNADNYEAVFLPAGTTGAISVTVTGFNIAGDGVPNTGDTTDQDFAFVCYNCATCAGSPGLNRSVYSCNDTVNISLGDQDLVGDGTLVVTIRSTTEGTLPYENVTLTESPANSGAFSGSIPTTSLPDAHGDGSLSVSHGDTITVTYEDASACGPPATVEATAAVDCVPPVITNVHAIVSGSTAVLAWDTDEPANSGVSYGLAPPPPGTTPPVLTSLVTSHAYPVTGLNICSDYDYSVNSTDAAGNPASNNNGGAYFFFTSGVNIVRTYSYTGPAVPISDFNTSTATLAVPDTSTVVDADVRINSLTHTYDGDLELHVAAPDNTDVLLADNRGGAGDNFTNTRFDDEAGTAIGSGIAPFNGSFRPDGLLSGLDGHGSLGNWRLIVMDQAGGDSGAINTWDLILTLGGICNQPTLEYLSSTVQDACNGTGGGGGNAIADPGEDIVLPITARNSGTGGTTGVTGTLSSSTPGVTVTDPTGAWPNIPVETSAGSANHFGIALSPSFPCGTTASFTIAFSANEGSWNSNFSIPVGIPAPPDPNDCLALPASVIELSTDNGADGDNYTGTIFDDEAANSVIGSLAPFTGSFRPEESLATLDGGSANASWKLLICDDAPADLGNLSAWGLQITTGAGTTTYNSTDVPKAIPDVRNPPVVSSLATTDPSAITDVNVTLSLTHTYDGDLDIYLHYNPGPLCTSCTPGVCGEVSNVRFPAGSETSLDWDAATNAAAYNVYRGVGADLPKLYTADPDSCRRVSTGLLTTGSVLTETPPPGDTHWLLVRGINAGGEGTAGSGTPGPRIHNSSGACP